MITLAHTSASSIDLFVQCPAQWIANYDTEMRVVVRNDRADTGTIIHGALEMWRNPENDYPQTYEALEACFDKVSEEKVLAEKFIDYKRAKELLATAYKMSQFHPVIPVQDIIPYAVEQPLVGDDGGLWKVEQWPRPVKGSIDFLGLIPVKKPNEIIVFFTDYKTGRQMSHSEIVKEKVQCSLYFTYIREIIVPYLESQICEENNEPYKVLRVVGSWDFIDDEVGVPIYESDIDHDETIAYIATIIKQQVELADRWNNRKPGPATEFLAKYEKPNSYCVYCPRKSQCTTFQKLREYEGVVDPTDPAFSWDEIWAEFERYQALAKAAESYLEKVKDITKVYLSQEGLSSIKLKDGREIVADQQTNVVYRPEALADILGAEFLVENAKISKAAVEKYVADVMKTDPARGRILQTQLQGATTTQPGARPVKARKAK